jgi:tetratricopeptide (TPR) repeat protein
LKLGAGPEVRVPAALQAAVHGDWDQASQLFQKALASDPLDGNLLTLLAWAVDLRSGRYTQAESAARRVLEINPKYGSAYWFLGLSLLFQNRNEEALAAFKQERPEDGQFEGSALAYHAMGKRAESDAALKQAIERNADSWASAIARVYAFRGEKDRAMQWLERAYAAKDEDLYLIKYDPLLRNLEGEARYRAFLGKMNLPET